MPGIDKNSGPSALTPLIAIALRRGAEQTLSEQIFRAISDAIAEGRLAAGARVPSCRDLAAQLGVARGTVRNAYDMLVDAELLVAKGAAGTWVNASLPPGLTPIPAPEVMAPLAEMVHAFDAAPLTFQMGVPASDGFPVKVWSRILSRHAREMATRPMGYSDPRGSLLLRQQLAAYLAMARGIRCHPAQILITNGYTGALGLICQALDLRGEEIWMEDPGYLLARKALTLAGLRPVPVPVDKEGISVSAAEKLAAEARLALVTPGQQSPLGMVLSMRRRSELLAWAERREAWIIEDDYLGELQLQGRAAPALASLNSERVLYCGTLSKTLTPAIRLGYLVVPMAMAQRFGETSALLAPASSQLLHRAVAEFFAEGHFMRHLRRMKKLYAERQRAMLEALRPHFPALAEAALGVVVWLPPGCDDVGIARAALSYGMAPSPLSMWYQDSREMRRGLMLSVTTLPEGGFSASARQLKRVVDELS